MYALDEQDKRRPVAIWVGVAKEAMIPIKALPVSRRYIGCFDVGGYLAGKDEFVHPLG